MSSRISRDDLMMGIARLVSCRATCPRLKVGAVIGLAGRPMSVGYCGAPPGFAHCTEVGCHLVDGGCQRTVHAEENAIAFAARNGIATRGATLYTTHSPCRGCSNLVIAAGIVTVVYESEYRDQAGLGILREADVVVRNYQ